MILFMVQVKELICKKTREGGTTINKRKLIKVNHLLTDTFVCVFVGRKSNLSIINNNIDKGYEITSSNTSFS